MNINGNISVSFEKGMLEKEDYVVILKLLLYVNTAVNTFGKGLKVEEFMDLF